MMQLFRVTRAGVGLFPRGWRGDMVNGRGECESVDIMR